MDLDAEMEGARAAADDIGSWAADFARELVPTLEQMASDVLSLARSLASTKMEQRAAGQLRQVSVSEGGGVALVASAQVPYALGAEFGAGRDSVRPRRLHRTGGGPYVGYRQFKESRGSGDNAGYFLWPAVRRIMAEDPEGKLLDVHIARYEKGR